MSLPTTSPESADIAAATEDISRTLRRIHDMNEEALRLQEKQTKALETQNLIAYAALVAEDPLTSNLPGELDSLHELIRDRLNV